MTKQIIDYVNCVFILKAGAEWLPGVLLHEGFVQ